MRVRIICVALVAGLSLAACGGTTATGSSSTTSAGETTTSASTTGTSACPKASLISTAMGSAYVGPIVNTGGTAGCNYDSGTLEVLLLFGSPVPKSVFISQSTSGLGPTATALAGLGAAAYTSTAYGKAQVDVYVSSNENFSVYVVNAKDTVPPGGLPEVEAVARAVIAS